MDALSERGQSLVLAALLLGLAAVAISGVRSTQERLLADIRDQRAGEAAAAAAGTVVADHQFAVAGSRGGTLTLADVEAAAHDDELVETARTAAAQMAASHGIDEMPELVLRAYGFEIEVHLTLRGRQHVVLLQPPV